MSKGVVLMLYGFASQTQEFVETFVQNNAVSLKIYINFKGNSIISYNFSLKILEFVKQSRESLFHKWAPSL